MTEISNNITVGQIFYGSVSGYQDYEILAASSPVGPDELDLVEEFSNVGGKVKVRPDAPPPIICFYPLNSDKSRWAYAKTFFLGMNRRGNDYLCHVLTFDRAVLDATRWDIFLFDPAFRETKPEKNAPIEPLCFSPEFLENKSRRHLGSTAEGDFPPRAIAGVFRELSRAPDSPLLIEVDEMTEGEALCRSVFSFLPPEDRQACSFCSSYSYTRHLPFDIAAFTPPDGSLIQRYQEGAPMPMSLNDLAVPPETPDVFNTWVETESSTPVPPLRKLSVLARPEEGEYLARYHAAASPGGLNFKETPSMTRWLYSVCMDRGNTNYSMVKAFRRHSIAAHLISMVGESLHHPEGLSHIHRTCSRFHGLAETSGWFSGLLTYLSDHIINRNHMTTPALSAGIALALFPPPSLKEEVPPEFSDTFLQGSGVTARWLPLLIRNAHETVSRDLLVHWFRGWREHDGEEMTADLSGWMRATHQAWGEKTASPLFRTILSALSGCAPEKPSRERTDWFVKILRATESFYPNTVPPEEMSGLLFQEGVFHSVGIRFLRKVSCSLVEHSAPLVSKALEATTSHQPEIVELFLDICLARFLDQRRKEPDWDYSRSSNFLAQAATIAASVASSPQLMEANATRDRLTWLMWTISRHEATRPPDAPLPVALGKMIGKTMSCLLLAPPKHHSDIALWAAYSLLKKNGGYHFFPTSRLYMKFRSRVVTDAGRKKQRYPESYRCTLIRLTFFDRIHIRNNETRTP